MRRKMNGGHRFALMCMATAMISLGSSPALADDPPIGTLASAVEGTTSATSIDDPVDAVGTVVDTVSSTASSTVDTVSPSTSATVDPVSSTTSTTVDTVSGAASGTAGAIGGATSGAGQSVSGSAETLTGSAADSTEALGSAVADSGAGTAAGTASGTTPAAHQPGGSSAHTVTSSDSTQGVHPLAPHGEPTLFPTLQEQGRPEGTFAGSQGEGPCSDPASPACAAAAGVNEGDSLAEKVAKIIGLLALTGLRVLPWVAAALILAIVGSLALERGRPRRSETHAPTA